MATNGPIPTAGQQASKCCHLPVPDRNILCAYDTNRGLPVLLEDGTRRYVWGLGLAYEVEGTSALVYHVDGLGSVRAITDATKAVGQTYESDEFGVPITTSGGSAQPFGFTGEQNDPEVGLVYLRARQYDPLLGRFVSRDRWAGSARRAVSLNRFTYVSNNPATHTDPSGFCTDPDPGGSYPRYCIETFIPDASVGGFRGDNRGPNASGGTFRTHQQVTRRSDGSLVESHNAGTSIFELTGHSRQGDVWLCGAAKARTLRNDIIRSSCSGSDGLAYGVAPPAVYTIDIEESEDSVRVSAASGTLFPSIEVWKYGPDGARLIFFYDSAAAGTNPFTDLWDDTYPLSNSSP